MRRICEQFSETCLRPRLVALHRDRVHAESLSEYALRLRVWRPYPRCQDRPVKVVELANQAGDSSLSPDLPGGDGVLVDPHRVPRGFDQRLNG